MSDIIERVLSHAPVDTRYVGNRWHPGRATLRGFWIEARVLGSSLIKPTNHGIKKFLIISRARSGSTLLTQLLNSHPDVRCARELLAKRVLFPRQYLNNVVQKNTAAAFGMKLLSYQMVQVQRLRDPVGFLGKLEQNGFRLIHLERDTFAQTVSLMMAQTRRIYHQSDGSVPGPGRRVPDKVEKAAFDPVEIDVDDFIRRLEWNDMLLEYEQHCLRDLPHLQIPYETGLKSREARQQTADQAFEWIGMPSAPVNVGLKKILPSDPRTVIANYDALAAQIQQRGLARLLPQ